MKKKSLIAIVIFSAIFHNLTAQINIGGEPLSFSNKGISKNIPLVNMPVQDNTKLITEAEQSDRKDRPWQFGKNIDVNIDVKKQAVVEVLPKGKLYCLSINSKSATTLNLRFSKFKIPKNAVLYIYNNSKTDIIGGFTKANMQESGTFATALIKGDYIVLEYFEPNNTDFSGELTIDRITHGFRSINDFNKGFGSSGDCNMNVICPDADDWRNEIRSVCMIVTGGSALCSASLVNNTQEDGTPYILTADHCYEDPSYMVFMFNWESETCDNPTLSPAHDDLSGASLIARNSASDFCLFEMNDIPPYDYEVYYAGWNAYDIAAESSVGIHHPQGDIKKISFDDQASISDLYLGNQGIENSHWQVIWDRETTTEGGSSGSPLYSENHQIIGQLHGGHASCANFDAPDWYGKFSFSWDYGSTPETRLKDWLNPTTPEIKSFPGYDPNVPTVDNDVQILKIINPGDHYFGIESITPAFQIRNHGNLPLTSFNLSYSINNGLPTLKHWTGNLSPGEITIIEFDEISLSSNKYTISGFLDTPNGVEDEYKKNDTLRKDFFVYETIFYDDFEQDNSWYLTGEFQIDKPIGIGGGMGFPDPDFAISGEYILGTDLTGLGEHPGDYENSIQFFEYAQSPVIDCRSFEHTILTFQRWLGTEKEIYDGASIRVYADSVWTTIWDNRSASVIDTEWKSQSFDISEIANGKKVIIQFITGETDHAEQYCGWNIDDVLVSGIRSNDRFIMEKHINLYPNPAENYFYIEINDELIENAFVTISDLTGRIIFNKEFKASDIKTIETTAYKKSIIKIEPTDNIAEMLIVKIKTNTAEYSRKVIYMNK